MGIVFGQRSVNMQDSMPLLEFFSNKNTLYPHLIREGKADALVLSADEQSGRTKFEEFAGAQLSSGGQSIELDKVTDRLAIRGKRLYQVSKTGQVLRTKQRGIWNRKKRPTYYFKVE